MKRFSPLYFYLVILVMFLLFDRSTSFGVTLFNRAIPVPILTVKDPFTQCTVHLVGVSHGSTSSSNLVKETILKIKPSSVVLELCDERYLAICLESQITPRGNMSMLNVYNKKVKQSIVNPSTSINADNGKRALLSRRAFAYASYIRKQGIVIGSFVTIGLLVSSFQRALRKSDPGDEFTTAMKVADYLNIPIKLGDAQQSETLRNVRKVISVDTVNPPEVFKSAKSLLFSALGLAIDVLPASAQLSEEVRISIAKSTWINIPLVYIQDKSLILSLIPLISLSLLTILLGYAPLTANLADKTGGGTPFGASSLVLAQMQSVLGKVMLASATIPGGHIATVKHAMSLSPAFYSDSLKYLNALMSHLVVPPLLFTYLQQLGETVQPLVSKITDFAYTEPPPALAKAIDTLADVLSFLVLVRLAKIIGSDRDRIIASKIRDACKTNPVRTIYYIYTKFLEVYVLYA